MRERRIGLLVVIALLALVAIRHPTANIRILTHDTGDLRPARVQAAVDLGVVAFSLLITWTKKLV